MTAQEIYLTLSLEGITEEFQLENIIYRSCCQAFDIYVEVLGQELWVASSHPDFFEWVHDGPWAEVIEDQLKKMRERQIKEPNKKKKGSSGEFVQFFRDHFIV